MEEAAELRDGSAQPRFRRVCGGLRGGGHPGGYARSARPGDRGGGPDERAGRRRFGDRSAPVLKKEGGSAGRPAETPVSGHSRSMVDRRIERREGQDIADVRLGDVALHLRSTHAICCIRRHGHVPVHPTAGVEPCSKMGGDGGRGHRKLDQPENISDN